MAEDTKKSPIYIMCSQMSGFCFDSAQFMAEKERDANKANPVMSGLFQAFVKICIIEKQYFSLSFLLPKRFLMKDTSLKSGYIAILNDLSKIVEWRSSPGTREMALQLIQFIEARQLLLQFYETIANTGATADQAEKSVETLSKSLEVVILPLDDNLHPTICGIVKKYKDCMTNELLKPLNDLFSWELDSLLGLFSCFHHLLHWRYFESLYELEITKRALEKWLHALQTITESRSSRFFSSSWFGGRASPAPIMISSASNEDALSLASEDGSTKASELLHTPNEPPLYSWLSRMRIMALTKFTLYFFDVLAKQAQNREAVVDKCVQLDNDIPGKLIAAQKRFEIAYVVLCFDASNEVGYKGPGFHYPEIKKPTLTGLNLFPCAFSWPDCPTDLWPKIVMAMDTNKIELNICNKIVPAYDNRGDVGYALIRVEPKMTLVIICQGKRPERDAAITGFMVEIAVQLRNCKSFASVKPGYK